MKDKKKIIIDGVDVSKCEFYCEEYCNLSNDRNERLPFAEKCTGYSDCCYKQLKRKEQECEKLKERLESFQKDYSKLYQVVENKGYIKELDQLKAKEQECEELREYHNKCCEEFKNEKQTLIDKYNQFSKDFFIGKYCKKEYCELLKVKEQAINAIKELAKNNDRVNSKEIQKIIKRIER